MVGLLLEFSAYTNYSIGRKIVFVDGSTTPKKPTLKSATTPVKKRIEEKNGDLITPKKTVTGGDLYQIPYKPHTQKTKPKGAIPSLELTSDASVKHIEEVCARTQKKEKTKRENDEYAKNALKHKREQERQRQRIASHGYGTPKLARQKSRLRKAIQTGKKVTARR